jgi:hypothetical protein
MKNSMKISILLTFALIGGVGQLVSADPQAVDSFNGTGTYTSTSAVSTSSSANAPVEEFPFWCWMLGCL